MCKFQLQFIGKTCSRSEVRDGYCSIHLNFKCVICGEQATHLCTETESFICQTRLCSKTECTLQHYYRNHPHMIEAIMIYEDMVSLDESDRIKLVFGPRPANVPVSDDGGFIAAIIYKYNDEYFSKSFVTGKGQEEVLRKASYWLDAVSENFEVKLYEVKRAPLDGRISMRAYDEFFSGEKMVLLTN